MKRRAFLKSVTMAVGATALPGNLFAEDHIGRPNIIVIMADDVSAKEFGCYGNTAHRTPNIDRMAKEGVKFETAWCTPICSPTRAMVMTGRYADRTGWWDNSEKPKADLMTDHQCFAQPLKRAGYKTAICGKWQISHTTISGSGFDESLMWSYEAHPDYDGPVEGPDAIVPNRPARYWHPMLERNGKFMKTTASDYGPDLFVDFILDFAERNSASPFLVYYPMVLPHKSRDFEANLKGESYLPTPLPGSPGKKVAGSLKSNVEHIDKLLGKIRDGLQEQGLLERTVILFAGDNGTAGYGKGKVIEERGPRVPLIVYGPGRVRSLGSSSALISFVDIFATVCELGGADESDYANDSHSFAPLLEGRPYQERTWLYSYRTSSKKMFRTKRWLLDGRGRLYDCGDMRNEQGYRPIKNVADAPGAAAAMARFDQLRRDIPSGKADPTR